MNYEEIGNVLRCDAFEEPKQEQDWVNDEQNIPADREFTVDFLKITTNQLTENGFAPAKDDDPVYNESFDSFFKPDIFSPKMRENSHLSNPQMAKGKARTEKPFEET